MAELFGAYPSNVEINGVKYPVETDFRLMMRLEIIIQTTVKAQLGKALLPVIRDFYKGNIPHDADAAVRGMILFYRCGDDSERKQSSTKRERCYAFDADQKYFIAAFRGEYGIDLTSARMHWWEFSALFSGLGDDTELVRIMQYRATDVSKIKSRQEKARIRRLQSIYALPEAARPHYATAAESEKAMLDAVNRRYEEVRRMAEEAQRKAGEDHAE
jgi:hypothetical protein